ncbi:MAG TPA: saccharopine dehydrogenase NADP-binding domain-containing protein [Bacilli bacterium]|nr:saccharopine dehydrogenase NADP-binding domain-containing protein [Bacilli bacterium]
MKALFLGRIVIFGYGMVGQSFYRLLKEEVKFKDEKLFVIDKDELNRKTFVEEGGRATNFHAINVTKQNYQELYQSILKPGDALLDFSESTGNIDSLTWCLENNVHYLSTSSSNWLEDNEDATSYANFLELKALSKKYQKGSASSVIEIGANPGLVSLFVKRCLREIISCETENYADDDFENLIAADDYALLAKKIGVETIIISDLDTLSTAGNEEDEDFLANTWSPVGLYDEAVSLIELHLGTSFDLQKLDGKIKKYNAEDGYAKLNIRGIDTLEKTYYPGGYFYGSIITHEEALSLGAHLTVLNQAGERVYSPTVYFSYRPSTKAFNALQKIRLKNYEKPKSFVKLTSEISSGSEYLGVILTGEKLGSYYFGTAVDIDTVRLKRPQETPTIIQVTATAISGFKWIIANPKNGLLFPEELPEDFILENAEKYLGTYNFHKVDKKFTALAGIINN